MHEPTVMTPEVVLRELDQRGTPQGPARSEGRVGASTLNLVIYSPGTLALDTVQRLLPHLVERDPCRVIHVIANPDSTDGVQVRTRTQTQDVYPGSPQVACELITIELPEVGAQGLEGLVVPLLDPDLPVYLWWRGSPPFAGPLFDHLLDACDRMFFDSVDFEEPEEDLLWLTTLKGREQRLVSFRDLNWTRLLPWKALLAQFFDTAAQAAYLPGIDEVDIEYVHCPTCFGQVPSRPWLVMGWLASRLRWQCASPPVRAHNAEVHVTLTRDDRPVRVTLRPVAKSGSPGGLHSVELRASTPTPARFYVGYMDDPGYARTVMTTAEGTEVDRVVKKTDSTELTLMGRELEAPGRDAIYDETLIFIDSLLRLKD